MFRFISLVMMLSIVAGCATYPRYRPYAPTTPPGQQSEDDLLKPNDYIRFGLILQKYLGKPYAGTSDYDPGLDCSEFVMKVYREYNRMLLPRTAAEQFGVGKIANRRRLYFGDLVFFETERGHVSHVGIYVGYNDFIHVSSSRGVIISSLAESYWADRYVGARRLIGVTPGQTNQP